MGRLPAIALAGLCALLAAGCGGGEDEAVDFVTVANGSGEPIGLLLDGRDEDGEVDDRALVSGETRIEVGTLSSSATTNNEVLVFDRDRAPAWAATPWTAGEDDFRVELGPVLRVPLAVWIVRGPFEQQRDHALEALARTSAIWQAERAGVELGSVTILDATADPDAAAHHAFPAGADPFQRLAAQIGFEPGRLNVYWVDTVDGGTGRGRSDFGTRIAMGRSSGDELLSHEIGHAFYLFHVDGDPAFDQANVLHSASSVRRYLTEGQVFRAHFGPRSVLNALLAGHPPASWRDCGHAERSAACPALQTRVWADGSRTPGADPQALLDAWLDAGCLAGDGARRSGTLASAGAALEPALRAAYRQGPTPASLAALRPAWREAYRQRQRWLHGGRDARAGPDLRLPQASEAAYLARREAALRDAHRSAAQAGLELVATGSALPRDPPPDGHGPSLPSSSVQDFPRRRTGSRRGARCGRCGKPRSGI